MNYYVKLKPKAVKDLRRLQSTEAERVLDALAKMQDDLAGNVKRLTNYSPEYRLRVGNYRALFEIENQECIVVYRILHRKDAYR